MKQMGIYNPGPKRNMKVIALAVVCIVLAASLGGVTAIYLLNGNPADLKAQITDKDSTISSLQSQIAGLQAEISQLSQQSTNNTNDQIASLNAEISSLNDQIASYYNIAIMNSSSTLLYQQPITQDANATTQVFNDAIYYAGYVAIQATASADTTYAQVIYSYAGANFNYNQTLGTSGSAVFPVLPGTLQINIGNINQTESNNATISATYFY